MGRAKIAITLDEVTLKELDRLVQRQVYPNRSQAIQEAVAHTLVHLSKGRLASECAKLDPVFEKALAEEGMSEEFDRWPEY
ncbi:MAG: ribbon-helix-helix protein, CopG family [Deltaproteobacteria bacterium]|nr:ribbon-helix-helix protein, CopG family [Deltaproteobacteria bacterium]